MIGLRGVLPGGILLLSACSLVYGSDLDAADRGGVPIEAGGAGSEAAVTAEYDDVRVDWN